MYAHPSGPGGQNSHIRQRSNQVKSQEGGTLVAMVLVIMINLRLLFLADSQACRRGYRQPEMTLSFPNAWPLVSFIILPTTTCGFHYFCQALQNQLGSFYKHL